jgi:hypothetical protein
MCKCKSVHGRLYAGCEGVPALKTWLQNEALADSRFQWEMLDSWAAERRVRIFEKGMIAHPVLGASYPDGSSH